MSDAPRLTPDEIQELFALRATEGLGAVDQQTYDALVAADPALAAEAERYEFAVAATDVALLSQSGSVSPLPGHLRDGLLASAEVQSPAAPPPGLKLTGTPDQQRPAAPARSPLLSPAAFGWYAAAAALIALGFVLAQPTPERVVEVEVPVQTDDAPPAEQYAALADAEGTVAAAWGFNPDGGDARFQNATGEVIFNANTQAGYMKLAGLPVNDPTKEQYQLWIVDNTRGDENTNRIDGGVFNVNETGEVIIPIDAKLNAREPVVFAITVETPGGVVESKGPLHIVAAVPAE